MEWFKLVRFGTDASEAQLVEERGFTDSLCAEFNNGDGNRMRHGHNVGNEAKSAQATMSAPMNDGSSGPEVMILMRM